MSTLWLCLRTFVLWVIVGLIAAFIVFGTNIGEPVFTLSLAREVSVRSGDLLMVPIGLAALGLTAFDYVRFLKKTTTVQPV